MPLSEKRIKTDVKTRLRRLGLRSCNDMEGFLIRGWEPILPGVRWLYVRSSANQRPANGAGVSTPCGAVSTRGSPFSSPDCRSCRCMEGFLIRGWDPVVPGWRWLFFSSPSQSAIGRWGRGFHTVRGGFDPGGHRFRPWVVGVVDVWRDF